MSLFPGGTVPDGAGYRYSLDDAALADSMALFMEQEMALVYQGVKNMPLPATVPGDMRLLFVAIARGLLRYLSARETGNITAELSGFFPHTHQIHLTVDMNKP